MAGRIGPRRQSLQVVGRVGFVDQLELREVLLVRFSHLIEIDQAVPSDLSGQASPHVTRLALQFAQSRDNAPRPRRRVRNPRSRPRPPRKRGVDVDQLHSDISTFNRHDRGAVTTHLTPPQRLGRTRVNNGAFVRGSMDMPGQAEREPGVFHAPGRTSNSWIVECPRTMLLFRAGAGDGCARPLVERGWRKKSPVGSSWVQLAPQMLSSSLSRCSVGIDSEKRVTFSGHSVRS